MAAERPVVFVVDDDPSMRESLRDLVDSVGLEARVFGSAPEFLQAKRRDAPGCLVLDVRLPGSSGLLLACVLRMEARLGALRGARYCTRVAMAPTGVGRATTLV